MFTFEARAKGPEGTREFTFQTDGFDARAIVQAEAEKRLREGEWLMSVTRLADKEDEVHAV